MTAAIPSSEGKKGWVARRTPAAIANIPPVKSRINADRPLSHTRNCLALYLFRGYSLLRKRKGRLPVKARLFLPIVSFAPRRCFRHFNQCGNRSEEHTSELQS